ncbi:alpha/beta hydrolase [Planococcus sp. 4-30]|uniref:alpha/beta hydrolase n=1 Tax=Planococcus sp. 4-30 TaxID=2874583 RepID=UPI001CC13922|nr:esterase [Planococcus sp. 4-30]
MSAPLIYEMRGPNDLDPTKTYPALFIMHGMSSNEKDMLSLVSGFEEQCFIFSIRGPLAQPPGFAFFTIEGYGKPHRHAFDRAVEQVIGFVDWTKDEYPVDKAQIYLMGFSQGAILSMTVGLKTENPVKGIVALSGYVPAFVKTEFRDKSMKGLSLFISHGEMDQALPFEWGEASRDYFQQLRADVTFKNYPSPHTVSMENYQDFNKWLSDSLAGSKK